MLNNITKNTNGNYYPSSDYIYYKTNTGCSRIYKKDNILKIYRNYIPDYLRITEEIFNILKTLDESNFIKLEDYYYDNKMIGYTSKYIEHTDNFNILDIDKEIVKYNLYKLEKLILLFTKLNIKIDDVNYKNYLYNNEELILIDPDSYRFIDNDMSKEELYNYNYKKLLNSFMDTYIRSFYKRIKEYTIGSVKFNKIITDVFKFDNINNIYKNIDNFKLEKR